MFIFVLLIFGLFVGSFLGVLIDRIPNGKSFVTGRSICEFCKKELKWYDLFPILSFLLLRGKCRHCRVKLPLFYPLIEIITAILFALIAFIFSGPLIVLNLNFFVYLSYLLLMISSFIVIFFIDLKNGIIPDKILIFDTILTFIWLFFNPFPVIVNHLLAGLGSIAFFVIISYLFYFVTKKDGMGAGDIKMSFVLGIFLGFPAIAISLYLAFLTGAVVAVALILFKKKAFKGSLPFGPFLILGTFMSLFFQNQLYSFFTKLLGI